MGEKAKTPTVHPYFPLLIQISINMYQYNIGIAFYRYTVKEKIPFLRHEQSCL